MKNRFIKVIALFLMLFMCFNQNIAIAYDNKANTVKNDTTLNWGQFLGNIELQGVSDGKSPRTAEELTEKWRYAEQGSWEVTPGTPIVVGDSTYCYVNEKIIKINSNTGEVEATAAAPGSSMFFIYAAYGDGKIFVPRKNLDTKVSNVIAYDADTLQQLYVTDNIKAGADLQTPLMYHDGYIYFGTYGSKAIYAAYPTKDLDPNSKEEVISAAWTLESSATVGFSWNGATFVGDSCIFADSGKKRKEGSIIYSLNSKTGQEIDRYQIPSIASVTSTIVYYEKNNRIYFSASEDGHATVTSMEMNKDGTFNEGTLKKYISANSGGGSQSTPVIYNDRLYLGGGGGTMGSSEPFHVIDANTLKEIYTIDGLLTKGSAAITTAYATKENNHQVYIYMVPYAPDNGQSLLYIIKDSVGQTQPEFEVVRGVGDAQYASQSIDIDKNGNLIFYNDARVLYCFGQKNSEDSVINGIDVFNQIDRLPEVDDFKYYNGFEVKRIYERFNSLSDAEKSKVTNIEKLKAIMDIADKNPVDRINTGIESLPDLGNITLENKEKIMTLMKGYKKLTDEEKLKINNYTKLESAYNLIFKLEHEAQVKDIINDIDKLPKLEDLTSDDKGLVDAIYAKISNLSKDYPYEISNMAKLEKAKDRIEKILVQMDSVQKLIEEKLKGVQVNLKTRAVILEIDKACEGLSQRDLIKLTNYEYYLSPAKATVVNLLIDEYLFTNHEKVNINKKNIEEIKKIISEIRYYYAGVLEADKKYIKNFSIVDEVESLIKKYPKDQFNNTEILEEVKNSKDTEVNINAFQAGQVSKEIFNFAKKNNNTLIFNVFGENEKLLYSWTFEGRLLGEASNDANLNLNIYKNISKKIKYASKNIDGLMLSFDHEGALPGEASVKIYVGDKFKNGEELMLYFCNDDKQSFEFISSGIIVKDGYATIKINHCSNYVLTANEIKVDNDSNLPQTGNGKFSYMPIVALGLIFAGVIIFKKRKTA